MFLLIKKMILICQNIRSVLQYVKKKVVYDDKNLDLYCYIEKNDFFMTKIQICLAIYFRKRFSKKSVRTYVI